MKHILVGIDFTEADDKVLTKAKELAKAYQADLHLVHISAVDATFVGYPAFIYPGLDEREEELKEEKDRLKSMVSKLHEEGYKARAYMKEATTSAGLLDFAEEHEDGLLVIGTHSRNLVERALLGSTADRIIRKATIPVLVVPTF